MRKEGPLDANSRPPQTASNRVVTSPNPEASALHSASLGVNWSASVMTAMATPSVAKLMRAAEQPRRSHWKRGGSIRAGKTVPD